MSKTKAITPENMKSIATELMDYFQKEDLWYETIIYVAGERYFSDGWNAEKEHNAKRCTTANGTVYFVEENINVKDYIEYSNPDTITLAFEGPLYTVIDNNLDFAFDLDKKFLDEYGLYFELGYQWSMSAYEA